jgi:hypothetical protein
MAMSHSQVAHVWAQRSGRSARGFNMYADGNAVFSYGLHYCIARFVQTTPRKGAARTVVLFNANPNSISTAKHRSHVRRAIPSLYRVYDVPDADPHHSDNLRHFEAQAVESFGKAKRARVYADMHERHAERALQDAADYAADFGIRWKRPADVAELVAQAHTRAKREAAERAKAARLRAKREAEEAIQLRLVYADDFALWQSGDGPYSPPPGYRTDSNGSVYMRVRGDVLETSLGASVPLRQAVRVFQFVKLCRETGQGWKANGRTVRVGHFHVDEITPAGDMKAGCHSFTWERIAEAAELANVADVAAADVAAEASA